MRIAMIGRSDNGGLGNLLWEFHRHIQPERTLVINLGDGGRGPAHSERFPGAWTINGMDHLIPEDVVRKLCSGMDVLYSAELLYRHDVASIARSEGCATTVHLMPELHRRDYQPPDAYWAPTKWEIERLPPETKIVPVPVASDRLPYQQRTKAETFLHIGAPAMLDRNGTHLIIDSLAFVKHPVRLIIVGAGHAGPKKIGKVSIEWRNDEVENYFERYTEDIDVLLLPRRYAGLSLPMQEAASCGIPIVSLNLKPQNEWLPADLLVPAREVRYVRMAGGDFMVHSCQPAHLAEKIDLLHNDRTLVAACSEHVGHYAQSISWDVMVPEYLRRFEEVVAGAGLR